MSIGEWLELGKPAEVRFVVEREADALKIKDNPEFVLIMAQMILDALAYYTDGSFKTESLVTFLNPDKFEYKGHQFSVILGSDKMIHVGILAYKLFIPEMQGIK